MSVVQEIQENWSRKKTVVIILAAAYLVMGIALFLKGSSVNEVRIPDGGTVALSPGVPIAQRILGNDFCLNKITFFAEEQNISQDAVLEVYLTQRDYDINNSTILDKRVIDSAELGNGRELVLGFPEIKLLYNRDYYLVFLYTDSREDGRICLSTNGDSIGIYSGETNYGLSLAYSTQYFSHFNKIFFIWELLFIFGSMITAFCVIKKIYFWESAGVVCIASALWMYCFGIFQGLKWGYYSLLLLAVAAFIFCMVYILQSSTESLEIFWREHLKSGWICWCVLILLYLMADAGKIVQGFDEMTHWAVAAQDMYTFDSFSIHENSSVVLMRYPPIYTVFQYLFMQIYGKLSVGVMHLARHFLEMSLLMSCLEGKKNQKLPIVVMAVFCIGLPELFFTEYLVRSLYNDITVGIAFGYVLVQAKKAVDKFSTYHLATLLLAIMACILCKDTGLIFVLVVIGGMICTFIYQLLKEKTADKNWVKCIIAAAGAILTGELSWQWYLKSRVNKVGISVNAQTNTVMASGVRKNRIVEYLTGNGEPYQYEIITSHLKKLIFGEDFPNHILTLSFALWIAILCFVLWYLLKKEKILPEKGKWIIFILFISMGVAAAFQLLYTFTFSEEAALVFASERRYLGGFLTGVVMLFLYLLQDIGKDRVSYKKSVIGICITILLLTDFCAYYRGQFDEENEWIMDINKSMYEKGIQLRKAVQEKERVYIVSKGDGGNNYLYYRYCLMPAETNPRVGIGATDVSYYPVTETPKRFEYQITPDEWREVLKEYDYLYVDKCDRVFAESYGALFEDTDDIEDGGLYRINPDNDRLLSRYMTIVAEEE